jgi:endonuclease III
VQIPFPKRKVTRAVAQRELAILEATYPHAATALTYRDPFTLLIAVILSAQTTDAGVNRVTPVLFERYPTARALASAELTDVERIIKPTGFFRMKARSIVGAATATAVGRSAFFVMGGSTEAPSPGPIGSSSAAC